jgi:hypothetical protein
MKQLSLRDNWTIKFEKKEKLEPEVADGGVTEGDKRLMQFMFMLASMRRGIQIQTGNKDNHRGSHDKVFVITSQATPALMSMSN